MVTVKKPGSYHLNQVSQGHCSDKSHADFIHLSRDEEGTSPLWQSSLESKPPHLTITKHQEKKCEEYSIKYLTSILQNCQGHERQGKIETVIDWMKLRGKYPQYILYWIMA